MQRALLFAASLLLCTHAGAQTRKCTAPDGKVTYSDVACPDSTKSERPVETNGNTLDSSDLREKIQKDRTATAQAEAKERERADQEARDRQQAQAKAARQEAINAEKDANAYANCVRDVERQAPAEDVKAELFAACRTAGSAQRQTGMTEAALRDCIRDVERTGAFGKDKARQIAICHGADVKPEPPVVVLRPSVRTMGPPRITSCNGNQCYDDAGQRYFKQQGSGLLREDGKACQLAAGNRVRCP